jgi:hypothetical protein
VLHVACQLVDAHRGRCLFKLPARDGVGKGGLAGAALTKQAELAALPLLAALLKRLGQEFGILGCMALLGDSGSFWCGSLSSSGAR